MRWKPVREHTYLCVLDKGEEVMATMERFVTEQRIRGAVFRGIGAMERGRVAYWDRVRREYLDIAVVEQVEVLGLLGNVAWVGETPKIHAHITLGRRDGSAFGGHLREGVVFPTLEIFLDAFEHPILRRQDEETKLPLIGIDPQE